MKRVLPWLLVGLVFLLNYAFRPLYDAAPHGLRTIGGFLFLGVVFFVGARRWWTYFHGER
jgi:hypothetical protein